MSLYTALTQVLAPYAAKINGLLTGWDGTVYSTPGEAVREQINDLHVLIGDEPGTAIQASAVAYGDSDVGTELTNVNGRLDQLNEVLETAGGEIQVPIEQYSINPDNGRNTTSSYTTYYRTANFYKASHVKAVSTRGTLKTRIYFYASNNVESFVSAGAWISDIDEDIVYPSGAEYIRISGLVDGNPDNPLDLSAVTVEMVVPATNVIGTIKSDIEGLTASLDTEKEKIEKTAITHIDTDTLYNLIPSDTEWLENKQIVAASGAVGTYSGRYASGFIPIDASKLYIYLYIAVINKKYNADGTYTSRTVSPFVKQNYAFYDKDKNFVASESATNDNIKIIPATAKYVRVTVSNAESIPFARLIYAESATASTPTIGMAEYKRIPEKDFQMPLTGYENFTMICFGDSITHGDLTGNNDGLSYVNYAGQYLNADIETVGFGSTTAAKVSTSGTGLFCFPNLCDCIVSEDPTVWDALDAWAESGNTSYAEHLARLKAVDWSQVQAISILYGANDWAANVPVGSDYNVTPGNYDGGIAYGIVQLLTKYPHLQVMVLSPFYRARTLNGETIISDDPNSAGLTMPDYAESLKNIQKKLHVSVVDSGNWGINYLTMKVMSIDGTHPITDLGKQRIGHWFASAIQTHLSPI